MILEGFNKLLRVADAGAPGRTSPFAKGEASLQELVLARSWSAMSIIRLSIGSHVYHCRGKFPHSAGCGATRKETHIAEEPERGVDGRGEKIILLLATTRI